MGTFINILKARRAVRKLRPANLSVEMFNASAASFQERPGTPADRIQYGLNPTRSVDIKEIG